MKEMDDQTNEVLTSTITSFKEYKEVIMILDECSTTLGDLQVEAAAERMTDILNQYQELPYLLDPHIEPIVLKILSTVMDKNCHPIARQQGFKYLYLFSKLRGPKYLSRFLPHEVSDVEPVLTMLSAQDISDHTTWETQYCLLLWLSVVCMIPFDLVRLDGSKQDNTSKGVVTRILEIGKTYLLISGKSRDAASLLLAKFLTRPDVIKDQLEPFLNWTMTKFNSFNDISVEGMAARSGLLATVAAIFKLGKREDLIDCAKQLCNYIVSKNEMFLSDNSLLRKLCVKLIQRIGLTFLKPKLAKWRYQRGGRSLLDNLSTAESKSSNGGHGNSSHFGDEDDYDLPEELEVVIEQLLLGLRDKDTIVRWSAAKGIGRVTSRLPKDLADDIIESILQFYNYGENGSAWHGGCLALAEVGRRGLLLPGRLSDVVPVIMKALVYDEIKGSFSAGSNVRDAACYVCWSFARAYDAETMSAYVNQIASSLIVATIFDREVNCRRAAAAAFQENVGRQGSFPHGIDILTTADYFAVSNISHCFLDLSVYVAQYKEYTLTVVDHLATVKLFHWDAGIRQLASKALNCLVVKAPHYMASTILPDLLAKITSIDLNEKHGSILGISEIVLGLASVPKDEIVSDAINCSDVMHVIDKLKTTRQFRGHGEELMRAAACTFIENICKAGLYPNNPSIPATWFSLLYECLCHSQQQQSYQDVASDALQAFCLHFYVYSSNSSKLAKSQDDVLPIYLAGLASTSNNQRVGCSIAISRLPIAKNITNLPKVIEALIKCMQNESTSPGQFIDSRKCAVKAVTGILGLGIDALRQSDSSSSDITAIIAPSVTTVITGLIGSMKDYTTDHRGDIGSTVREAALNGLEDVSLNLIEKSIDCLDKERCLAIFCCVIKQAAEKIDRVRESAGKVLENLLHSAEYGKRLPHHNELREIFSRKICSTLNWASPADAFSAIVNLLHFEEYRYATLAGIVLSVGGLTESLVKHSSDCLLMHFSTIQDDINELLGLTSTILKLFSDYTKEDRVIVPLMKTLDLLLSNGSMDPMVNMVNIASCELPEQLFVAIKMEIRKCGDAKKLIAAIAILCGLMRFPGKCRRRSMAQLSILLCHRFPRVRKETSEQYYTALLICDEIVKEDWLDEALVILSDTPWGDTDISRLREVRDKMCRILGTEPPKQLKAANIDNQPVSSHHHRIDQLNSYRDLVGRQDL